MRTLTVLFVISGVALGACGKEKTPNSAQPTATQTPDPAAEAAAKAKAEEDAKNAEEAKKKEEAIARNTKALEDIKAKAAANAARWTEAMHKQAAALADKDWKAADKALKAIVASNHRTPGNADRDAYRHPAQTLAFFGIKPDMTVIEVGAGGGWYTEILAPLVAKRGKLVVAGFDPAGSMETFATVYGQRYKLFLDSAPELYGKVQVVFVKPPDQLALGPDGSADMALAFREMHNWHRRGYLPQYVASVHKVLKPGGVFGVVQHRAPEGANPDDSAEKGYLPEAWVIETVQKAGFDLAGKSEINANPKDTKDYEEGVWTLPPGYALEDKDKDKYTAIGESDRMTLKFVKRAP